MFVRDRYSHGSTTRQVALLAALALLLAVAVLPGVAAAQAPRTQYPGEIGTIVERGGDGLAPTARYRGEHRFDTARLIATDDQPDFFLDADTVLVARADIFPDALSGHYLAGQHAAPLLLVSTNQIVPHTTQALNEIGPQNIILLGGTEAISAEVEDQFRADFDTVRRIGGVDRYATAAMLAAEGEVGELDGRRTAFIANGNTGVDALVSGAIAFAEDLPILLTPEDRLDNDTDAALDNLGIEQVIITGGVVAVEPQVRDAIAAKGIDIIPIEGPTRVETALELAAFAIDNFDFTFDHVNFARGDLFVDALTIGPHAGSERSVLLLTATSTEVPQTVLDFLQESRTGCAFDLIHLAGGFLAISDAAAQQIRQAATRAGVPCNIDLDPPSAVNAVGEGHTVTATVTDNLGDPVGSVTVAINVTPVVPDDPQASVATPVPDTATLVTGQDGTATFDVTSETPGTVTIEACITDAEGDQVCDTATKTWTEEPVEPEALGTLTLEPALATNLVGEPHEITLQALYRPNVPRPAPAPFVNLDAYRLDPDATAPPGSPPGTEVYVLYEDSETFTGESPPGLATLTFPTVPPTSSTVLYLVACSLLSNEGTGQPFEGDCLEPGSGGQLLVVDGQPQNLNLDDLDDLETDWGRKEYVDPALTLTPALATNIVGEPHEITLEARYDPGVPAAEAFVNLDAYRLDPDAAAPPGSPPGTEVYVLHEDSQTVTDANGSATLTFPGTTPTDPTVLYLVACARLSGEAAGQPFEGDCLEPGSGGQLLVLDGQPQNLRADGEDDLWTAFGRKEFVPTGLRGIEMSGEEECSEVTGPDPRIECGVGDPDGSAVLELVLNRAAGEICWTITALTGVALPSTGFHIHQAPAGENGPIVVDLGTVTADGDSGCASGVDPALVTEIRNNPADFYANLHTSEFPAGAIRGQLSNGEAF